ncbi:hypothetical protein P0136_02320 [Lentisphaerota bacterium ZTH]|nr:hypothetical protein JYG24_06540 [Lentisphaerota bacterium]WET06836.1 hypothetical protein P0136_02320 [Lentisphaerota bacterium ZTH]
MKHLYHQMLFFLKALMFILSAATIFILYKDFRLAGSEQLPPSVFVLLLSLTAVTMSWVRIYREPCDNRQLVQGASIDLFLGTLFALVSFPIPWFCDLLGLHNVQIFLFVSRLLHCLLFTISLGFTLKALLLLLKVVEKHIDAEL